MRHITLAVFVFFSISVTKAATNTTGSSSNYSSGSAWTSGVPNLTHWTGSVVGNINHDLTYTGTLNATNNNILYVKSGATLVINGTLALGNRGRLTVESGGALIVNGSMSLGNNSVFNNQGTTNVTGNISMCCSADPVFGGTTTVGGNFTGTGAGSRARVTGVLDISGQLNLQGNAVMNGTGIVQWGSIYVYWSGFSYIYCNNGSRYGTAGWGHVDPPGNPLDLLSCATAVLAVELLSFGISYEDNATKINWVTASENNANYFELEFSKDASTWESKGVIDAVGYSNSESVYEYLIPNTSLTGDQYVRLVEYDMNGNKEVFPVKIIDRTEEEFLHLRERSDGAISISHNFKSDAVEIQIIDLQGKLIHQVIEDTSDGSVSTTKVGFAKFQKGMYILQLTANGKHRSVKFLHQ